MPTSEPILIGLAVAVMATIFSGLRRLPWVHAAGIGLGFGIVFAAFRAASYPMDDYPTLVLLGALGASIATLARERGERAREQRSAAILGQRSTAV